MSVDFHDLTTYDLYQPAIYAEYASTKSMQNKFFSSNNSHELTIYAINGDNITEVKHVTNRKEVVAELHKKGISLTQWPANHEVRPGMSNKKILALYKNEIAELVENGGYKNVDIDVISIHADNRARAAFREKFLREHTHTEDEVRIFVEGQGLFSMHIDNQVYVFLASKNDLLIVPAGTKHWFDMGEYPDLTVIRFNSPEGWAARYTGSNIAEKFPLLQTTKPLGNGVKS